jgi:hypothetical protein
MQLFSAVNSQERPQSDENAGGLMAHRDIRITGALYHDTLLNRSRPNLHRWAPGAPIGPGDDGFPMLLNGERGNDFQRDCDPAGRYLVKPDYVLA